MADETSKFLPVTTGGPSHITGKAEPVPVAPTKPPVVAAAGQVANYDASKYPQAEQLADANTAGVGAPMPLVDAAKGVAQTVVGGAGVLGGAVTGVLGRAADATLNTAAGAIGLTRDNPNYWGDVGMKAVGDAATFAAEPTKNLVAGVKSAAQEFGKGMGWKPAAGAPAVAPATAAVPTTTPAPVTAAVPTTTPAAVTTAVPGTEPNTQPNPPAAVMPGVRVISGAPAPAIAGPAGPLDAHGNSMALTNQYKAEIQERKNEDAQLNAERQASLADDRAVADAAEAKRAKWEAEVAASSIMNRPATGAFGTPAQLQFQAAMAGLQNQKQIAGMTTAATMEGHKIAANTATRGQDVTARGQNIAASTASEGHQVQKRGQDVNAATAAQGHQVQLHGQNLQADTQLATTGMNNQTALATTGMNNETSTLNNVNTNATSARNTDVQAAAHKDVAKLQRAGVPPHAEVQKDAAGRTVGMSWLEPDGKGGWTTRTVPMPGYDVTGMPIPKKKAA